MSKTTTTIPTRSTEPTAPDYAVPDPQEAWERFDRLVSQVLITEAAENSDADSCEENTRKKSQ